MELSIQVVRSAYDTVIEAIDHTEEYIATSESGGDEYTNAVRAKITFAAEAIRHLEMVNADIKELLPMFNEQMKQPLQEMKRSATEVNIKSNLTEGDSDCETEVIHGAKVEATHMVGLIEDLLRTCTDVNLLRIKIEEGVAQVNKIKSLRSRVDMLLKETDKLDVMLNDVIHKHITCRSTYMNRQIQSVRESIKRARKHSVEKADDDAVQMIETAKSSIGALVSLEQDELILIQDYKVRVDDPFQNLKKVAEEYGTTNVGVMRRFFNKFDEQMRDFSAAMEMRGAQDESLREAIDTMAADVGKFREINKNLANIWTRYLNRVKGPSEKLKETVRESLLSSIPVIKRVLLKMTSDTSAFEKEIETGQLGNKETAAMLDQLASEVRTKLLSNGYCIVIHSDALMVLTIQRCHVCNLYR